VDLALIKARWCAIGVCITVAVIGIAELVVHW
jgi:hypothetical protein